MCDDQCERANPSAWQAAVTKNTFIHAASSIDEDDDALQGSRFSRWSSEPAGIDEERQPRLCLASERLGFVSRRQDNPSFVSPAERFSVTASEKVKLSVEGGGPSDLQLAGGSRQTSAGSRQTSSGSGLQTSAGSRQSSNEGHTSSNEDYGGMMYQRAETNELGSGYTADCSGSASQPSGSGRDSGSGPDSGSGRDSDAELNDTAKDKGGSRTFCADAVPWGERITTVMIRRLARAFTQWMLIAEANNKGFDGLFDFVYVPFDSKKGCNIGYGFMNFMEPKSARAFRDAFDGSLEGAIVQNGKPLSVHPAKVQGYEENFRHFMLGKACLLQDHQVTPLFLRRESHQQSKSCTVRGHWTTIQMVNLQGLQSEQETPRQNCHHCGARCCSKHNFCANCGSSLKQIRQSCGTSLRSAKDNFDRKCGAPQ